jgi:hypothetical protein
MFEEKHKSKFQGGGNYDLENVPKRLQKEKFKFSTDEIITDEVLIIFDKVRDRCNYTYNYDIELN